MIEGGRFTVSIPEVREWDALPLSPPAPAGIDMANTFYTNENGSKVVFYLTPGNHDRLWADMDEFARLESSSRWQQFLARDYIPVEQYRALRVLATLGGPANAEGGREGEGEGGRATRVAEYFFEADPTTLLVVACTFGRCEPVSTSRFDFLFSGFHIE